MNIKEEIGCLKKIEKSILCIWILLWLGLGTQINDLFILKSYQSFSLNFIRSNIIFVIAIYLIFLTIHYKIYTKYLFLIIYPLSGMLSYYYNLKTNFYFSFHYSISFFVIILFLNLLNSNQINKKLIFKWITIISSIILLIFFILIIFPDFFNKIQNYQVSGRGENINNINFFDIINVHIPQNSNGASRIVLIIQIYLTCFYSFILVKDKNYYIKITILTILVLLGFLNLYYQSKLNYYFYYLFFFAIIFLNKINIKNKILSFLIILLLPLIFKSQLETKSQKISNLRFFNEKEGIMLLAKPDFLKMKKFSVNKNIYFDEENLKFYQGKKLLSHGDLNLMCNYNNHPLDKFFGGRVCGWEILFVNYFQNFKLYGYGYFADRETLGQFQKIASNTLVFVLYNNGIVSFIIFIASYILLIFGIKNLLKKFFNLKQKINIDELLNLKFFTSLTVYLFFRSFFEDTLAYISIDLLLLINCIIFFNYFFEKLKNR